MSAAWKLASASAGAYLALAILWHVSGSYIADENAAVRSIGKGACLGAAALLFLIASFRLTAHGRGLGVLRGAMWSAGAVAGEALAVALFEAWRTDWGRACNQCDPAVSIVAMPLAGGTLGLLAALSFGWVQAWAKVQGSRGHEV